MDQKKELGKGIRALLGNMESQKQTTKAPALSSVTFIPLSYIETSPFQPRTEFDPVAMEELAATIKLHGLIQPITVRRLNNHQYQLISGERRTRAARLAGLTEIPVFIRTADDQAMLEMALIENIHRENLNPLEVAISMFRLIEECKLTHEEMSIRWWENYHKDPGAIIDQLYLRLLMRPPSKPEKDKLMRYYHARPTVEAIADMIWVMVVSPEFQLI